MEPAVKKLRDYQVRLVTDVCRTTGDVLVEQSTGSGKTVQIVTLVAMHLGHRFSHALIAAPQEQIEQGFVMRDYVTIAFPGCEGAAQPTFAADGKLILGARKSGLGSVKQIAAYLRQPGPLDYALACTHAALNLLTPEQLPDKLAGKALFIDEAHHASADGLSQIVTLWRERGGQVLFFTATPYRGDGRPVKLDGMRTYRRSLAEHMAEGFAPRHLDSEIVALGQPGDSVTAAQFTGEEAPPASYFDALVEAICRRWQDDGQPKAIVRVPPMQGGKSGELVRRLTAAFRGTGFRSCRETATTTGSESYPTPTRVLDATGTTALDKQRFLTALKTEQRQTFATSTFDVMIGIQRVLEGTDWPLCSAAYCVGMPGSLNTVVQFLGRAMRLKGPDYPEAQRDRAKLVFFVPCGGGTALADLSIDHSRHALLTCCFLADHEVGQEWIVTQEVRRGIEAALGPAADNPVAADAVNEADEPMDPEVRAEVELAIASAREQIVCNGGEPTLGEVMELTAKTRPDLPEAAIERVAAEILAAQTTTTGAAARKAIHQEIAKRLRIDSRVKQAMTEAFAIVLDEFRNATLSGSLVLESVGRQLHTVTGGHMREFAKRLREAAPRPLTLEQILTWADAHYERTGEWPGSASGPVDDAPDEKWGNINAALDQGLRGLPGGSSLAQLLAEKRGVRNVQDLPNLTQQMILAWADNHFERSKQWPRIQSGVIADAPDEKWANIHAALDRGHRGLAGGSSLAKLLAEERGVRNTADLPPLTEDQILNWADAHKVRTRKWPNQKSGPVNEAPGETWSGIQTALQGGGRGFTGGSSLVKLLEEKRGKQKYHNLPLLTEEKILTWADGHHERTGEWPKVQSGAVMNAPEENWASINSLLQSGSRGLSGGSSVAKLLEKHRGVRNSKALPPLTKAQILAWADAHYERTGDWPRVNSGPLQGVADETWTRLDHALRYATRGLPGGSSLAQLLLEERRARNQAALPPLTNDQILVWADSHFQRTGQWPTLHSGPIGGGGSEKWRNVDNALRLGLRGFPGGSSVAKLLAQERGVRNSADRPSLSESQILDWADSHKLQTGMWPNQKSGPVHGVPGETWANIHQALNKGLRGFPGRSSLARLIKENRVES